MVHISSWYRLPDVYRSALCRSDHAGLGKLVEFYLFMINDSPVRTWTATYLDIVKLWWNQLHVIQNFVELLSQKLTDIKTLLLLK